LVLEYGRHGSRPAPSNGPSPNREGHLRVHENSSTLRVLQGKMESQGLVEPDHQLVG
jgi:hypothetical protein